MPPPCIPPIRHNPSHGGVGGGGGRRKIGVWITNEDDDKMSKIVYDSQRNLTPVVRLANIFGLMPLSQRNGIFTFIWCCPLTIYAIIVIFLMTSFLFLRVVGLAMIQNEKLQNKTILSEEERDDEIGRNIMVNVSDKNNCDWVRHLTATVFYILGPTGAMLLLRLATRLPNIINRWASVEDGIGIVKSSRIWIWLCCVCVMLSAIGETTLSMFYNIDIKCTISFWRFLECYVMEGYKFETSLLGYTDGFGLLILVINKYATMVWNFIDILIASVAIVLIVQVRRFNDTVKHGWCVLGGVEWSVIRENHLSLIYLVKDLDAALGPLILQSYITNIFFTLVQLYLGLRPSDVGDTTLARLYLTWSFLHLLGRLILVSFTCSGIHEEIKQAFIYLSALPTERYSVEVWRLQHQMQQHEIAFSGLGFFIVNKSFILATTGALVTYEVILLQLSSVDHT